MKRKEDPSARDEPMPQERRRSPLFGSMKGTVTIAPGVDLTEPAMPEWADLIEEKYGNGLDDVEKPHPPDASAKRSQP